MNGVSRVELGFKFESYRAELNLTLVELGQTGPGAGMTSIK